MFDHILKQHGADGRIAWLIQPTPTILQVVVTRGSDVEYAVSYVLGKKTYAEVDTVARRKYKYYPEKDETVKTEKPVQKVEQGPEKLIVYRGEIVSFNDFLGYTGLSLNRFYFFINEGFYNDHMIFIADDRKEAEYYVNNFNWRRG